jgi:ketosteroid isomerase-like protein
VSQDNVEVVRRVYEAVARRDAAAVLALYDPAVEVDTSRLPEATLVGMSLIHGHEGLRRITREWDEAWDSTDDDCEELIDAGQHVIAVVTRRGRGRASGVDVATRRGGIWTIRDGKVLRVVWFPSVQEALKAVGLEE